MKAIRINEYGGREKMKLSETERPVPEADEILVKVYASGVNPVDLVVRAGSSGALTYDLSLPMTLGWDAAGTVEQMGSGVTGLQKGDAVYGVPTFPGDGSYAEYCLLKANRCALKPKSLSYNAAAGVPLAAMTAWTAIFQYGKLTSGQRVLIQGATGSVGAFAVQFAKAKGAYVIGVTSTDNLDYLKKLGADEAIDYKTQRFEELLGDIEIVLEASSVRDNKERLKAVRVLRNGGILVSVNTDFAFNDEVIQALDGKGAKGEMSANQPSEKWLAETAQMIDDGKVKVLLGRVFPLEKVAQAHKEIETGCVRGKVVLEIRKG